MSLVDSLVEDLFSAEAEIIVRPIEQLFIIPSTLRLPMGRQGQLQAFAVDAMGGPSPKWSTSFNPATPPCWKWTKRPCHGHRPGTRRW